MVEGDLLPCLGRGEGAVYSLRIRDDGVELEEHRKGQRDFIRLSGRAISQGTRRVMVDGGTVGGAHEHVGVEGVAHGQPDLRLSCSS